VKGKHSTYNQSCEAGSIVAPKDAHYKIKVPQQQIEQEPEVQTHHAPFTGELYAHQKEAFEMFKDEPEVALFMEMGTGKSATVLRIAGYKFKQHVIDALLIVAPNDVHRQWATEQIPLWLDVACDMQCLYGRGGQKQSYPFVEEEGVLQVVVVNIDTFSTPKKWQDIVDWANTRRTMIVLDEATVIKNHDSQRTQRMLYAFNDVIKHNKTIVSSVRKSAARAILTGTPVTNGPMDMWAMMEFLRPNYFGRNWYSFQAHFGMFTTLGVNDHVIKVPLTEEWWHSIKAMTSFQEANAVCGCSEDTFNTVHSQEHYEGPYKHADELKKLIEPVSYFKQLIDCQDMPAQLYNSKTLLMTPEIEGCYNDMIVDLIAKYEDHVMTAKSKLTALIRLQQISSGFLCDKSFAHEDDDEDDEQDDVLPNEIKWIGTTNPKLEALYRDIDELVKPVVIITRFTAEAARIYDELCTKYRVCLITGWKRVGTIQEYQDGKFDVMVANVASVARGFNLQNGCNLLFYSNTYSLELRLQAEGRIFRIGQKNPCVYTDYIYEGTIDEKVVAALKMKRNLIDYIRSADVKELVGATK
jgi:SNF2 family DNA or RNA helicase